MTQKVQGGEDRERNECSQQRGGNGHTEKTDSLGEADVPSAKLWGAQTQRSSEHFGIGQDLTAREMITAYATLRKPPRMPIMLVVGSKTTGTDSLFRSFCQRPG
jgi:hypothetical protein